MLNAERFKEKILDVVEDDKKYNFAIKDDDPNAFSNCHSDISCKNCIRAYRCKPYKEHFVWYPYNRDEMPYDLTLFDDLFAFVTFEDSEPTSIEYVLKNCEVIDND